MNRMFKVYALFACILVVLSGCASSDNALVHWFSTPEPPVEAPVVQVEEGPNPETGLGYRADSRAKMLNADSSNKQQSIAIYRAPNSLYQPAFTHKSLSDYAEQLTMSLVKNGRQLNTQSKVGVASFVNFDKTLKQTSVLGNQLAEMLIVEVQGFGVQVVDFKTTDYIGVGANGDLVFSRDARKLSNKLNLDYILSGTLIRNEKGVRVNARVVSMDSKIVVSSASILIPNFVVKSLQPEYVIVGE
ncbi:FlgO family outer membrane protein [Aliiglaciecola sp. SL4]|uniref:FlgO family outer membrane protein n=1 Tax=Aliiglaciecola sp. SL4 TaxID=3239806 RepID=UPI00355BA774